MIFTRVQHFCYAGSTFTFRILETGNMECWKRDNEMLKRGARNIENIPWFFSGDGGQHVAATWSRSEPAATAHSGRALSQHRQRCTAHGRDEQQWRWWGAAEHTGARGCARHGRRACVRDGGGWSARRHDAAPARARLMAMVYTFLSIIAKLKHGDKYDGHSCNLL